MSGMRERRGEEERGDGRGGEERGGEERCLVSWHLVL
jgi:hypothetical protein